jgi:hypothetical protein
MKELIGFCGLDCEKCEARIATANDDNEMRARVAALWTKLNGVEITPDMINCDGCRVNGRKTVFCKSLCQIRQCAKDKQADTCADCPRMNGCDKLRQILDNSAEARENLSAK